MTAIGRALGDLREHVRRSVENYRTIHVPRRCQLEGCDCPCGFCNHDARHIPGRLADRFGRP